MSTAQVATFVLAIKDYAWLAPFLPAFWFLHRTRTARTVVRISRVAAWDWLLRLKGVPESTRRKLIADAAQHDIESRDS